MRISVAIQHHPSRAGLLPALREALELDAEIVDDPDPDTPSPATWPGYRLALERTPSEATHRLIVQDDVRPCADFAAVVAAAAAVHPSRVLVLCVCGQPRESASRVVRAAARGDSFVEIRSARWLPAMAVLWPAGIAEAVLGYVGKQTTWRPSFNADDEILGRSISGLGLVPVATVPSIVDHPDDVASVIKIRRKSPDRTTVVFDPGPGTERWTRQDVPFTVR